MAIVAQDREQLLSHVKELVETLPGLGWSAWPNGDFMCFSGAMERYMGQQAEHLTTKDANGDFTWKETVLEEEYAALSNAWLDAVNSKKDEYEVTHRIRGAGGELRWLRSTARPQRDSTGEPVYWLGISVDIHEAMTAMERSQASERQLRRLIDTVPGMIWAANERGEPIYYNKRLEEWGGVKVNEIEPTPGQTLLSAVLDNTVHAEDRARVESSLKHCISSGEPWMARFRQRRADGTWRWMEGRMEALRDDNGAITHWYGLELDIENETRAQESLRDASEKLAKAAQVAGMAELSASIAHEVSQPLASALANADACRRWLAMTPSNVERARISAECALRDANAASEVVRKVRALFQKHVDERELRDINSIIAVVCDVLRNELSSQGIQLLIELAESLPSVRIDVLQIQQVLVNLVRNAADSVTEHTAGDRVVIVRSALQNHEVVVEVEDFGKGIVNLDKIFSPFFTTKKGGMGMGLSISKSILFSHNGRLWARNTAHGAIVAFALSDLPPQSHNVGMPRSGHGK
ncbi:PAS domain-containing sensor histidine kinase [Rhizobium sp. GCM10022189]|uniref:PAS domain-containing sensor histidine kinase n=1 Tax=Rhizobium sp. GCM10022189 TaxID=3252654 RepID=UPI00360BD20F